MTSKSKCVWGAVPTVPICSLNEVMSEELVQKLQTDDIRPPIAPVNLCLQESSAGPSTSSAGVCADVSSANTSEASAFPAYLFADNPETQSDYALAQMLQKQFDQDYNEDLTRQEIRESGNSKVSVSYRNLLRTNQHVTGSNEETIKDGNEEEEDYDDDDNENELFDQGPSLTFNRSGYSGKGANIRTKHDKEITEKNNASKVLDTFYPDFNTGDTSGLGLRLSNRVYNEIRVSAHQDQRRRARVREPHGADRATAERALDEKTRDIVFRLIQADRLSEVTGVVSTGKEAVVLHAIGGDSGGSAEHGLPGEPFPSHCAIKVFKTTLNEFKNRRMYINGDYRFHSSELHKRQNPRKMIRRWAEKEMMNLKRMHKAGLPCPQPLFLRKHVLVMSFIGGSTSGDHSCDTVRPAPSTDKYRAAPQLKMCAYSGVNELTPDQWDSAYHQTLEHMSSLYHICNLVHADLSEYNLLWYQDKVWIIDVSQSVDRNHPHAFEFLLRDCLNISTFFNKRGVEGVLDYEDHFNSLTGANIAGRGKDFLRNFAIFLSQSHDFDKETDEFEDPFELLFNRNHLNPTQEELDAVVISSEDSEDEGEESAPSIDHKTDNAPAEESKSSVSN